MDGLVVEPERAQLSVLSFGLNNAACVFEGIRVYQGRPFALREHVKRLAESAEMLGMQLPFTTPEVEKAIESTVITAGFSDAYVRPLVWRGDEAIGIDPTGTSIHVAVPVLRWPASIAKSNSPVRLHLSRWTRPAPNMAPVKAKASASYVIGALALDDAKRVGCDDALLLDHNGDVAEATGSNVFIVRNGQLETPPPETFLDGITRRVVIRLAEEEGIPVVVRQLSVDEVAAADEVFLTGTAAEIKPVGSFMQRTYAGERPVTALLAAAYGCLVRESHPLEVK